MDLKNKVIWITGASSGIGEALVGPLCREGAKLIISSRNIKELNRVRDRYLDYKDNIRVLPLDLSKPETFKKIVNSVLLEHDHVDVLINNGGISQRSLAMETDMETDRMIMEVDYFGQVALTKELLPHMIERRSGFIAVTSSIMGKITTPLRSTYCAAKHALHGFFDSLRSELWKDNIGILIICPAGVKTNVSVNALVGDGKQYGKMDEVQEKGMSAEKAAKKIVKAIKKEKEEILIGKGFTTCAVLIKRLFPGLFSRLVRKARVT